MKRILLALVLLLGASDACVYGSWASGNSLLEWLDSCDRYEAGDKDAMVYTHCLSGIHYIKGASDGFHTAHDWAGTGEKICFPQGTFTRQLRGVVKKYLDNKPHRLQEPAGDLVLAALSEAFPCP